MGREQIESMELKVPVGEGYIIGDILRKYALRSVGSWQVIGYKLDSQSVNFGFSNGVMVSYLELLKGVLVSSTEQEPGDPRIIQFTWDGQNFANGGFKLTGLERSVGDRLQVCIAYGRGHRSAEQNREVVRVAAGGSADGFFIVPSSHSEITTFQYSVKPLDDKSEWLVLNADGGVVHRAAVAAVKTLSSLNI